MTSQLNCRATTQTINSKYSMFTNNLKMILCASSTSLTAGIWHGNKLQSTQEFRNDEQGLTDFSAYLQKNTDTNIYLIANAVDEDYRVENLPHTSGKTRTEIIERKLNQFSRNAVYRTAHFISRATDKRKDDTFLFVALNNTDFIQGWINAINSVQAPLVGIYMLPMISQEIVRQQKLMAPHILLCEQLNTGLRQSYLHNGRLRMSRMVPMKDIAPNKLSAFYAIETDKTRLYLLSQRLITRETTLSLVLPSLDDYQDICQRIGQESNTECTAVDLYRFAKPYIANPEILKLNPELLHMQLLANGNIPNNLAPATMTKTHQLNNVRQGIVLASVLVAGLGLLVAGTFFYQSYTLNNDIKIVLTDTSVQQHLYNEVSKDFPASPIASSELKTAVDLAKNVSDNSKTPRRLMQVLSGAFDQQPEIQLTRLRWVLSNDANMKDDEGSAAATPVGGQDAQAINTGDLLTLLEIGFINAEIQDFTGDYRAAINSVTRFVALLKSNPAVEQVVVLQEPVNVSSFANLQGSTNEESSTERLPAVFKLRLVLKPMVALVANEMVQANIQSQGRGEVVR